MPMHVCPRCGAWEVEKRIESAEEPWALAVCSACGSAQRFLRLPLFVITGASGAGKTTVMHQLLHAMPKCVVIEGDILWGALPANADDDYRGYLNAWLRLVKTIAQAGRPVLFCGTAVPEQLESLPERRYIGTISYLALTCDPEVLRARLEARPSWRQASDDAFVRRMLAFNTWLNINATTTDPPMVHHDTTWVSPEDTAQFVRAWVQERL